MGALAHLAFGFHVMYVSQKLQNVKFLNETAVGLHVYRKGPGRHGDGPKQVGPKRVGTKRVEPMWERRRQLSLENSKINQIKRGFRLFLL